LVSLLCSTTENKVPTVHDLYKYEFPDNKYCGIMSQKKPYQFCGTVGPALSVVSNMMKRRKKKNGQAVDEREE